MSFKDRRIELERSNCGVVVVTPSISPRVYDALARVPGDVSYEMTPQQLVYSLLEKASTQTTVQEVTDEGGPYRSLRRRSVRRCVGCDEPLDIGYGDTKQHCLNCYPVQMDELIPVDEAELLRLQVPTCPLCKGLMRSNQEQAARIECEDCSASLVEISSLADRGLDPYLLLRTPAVASELACPRCAETMRSFVVSALVGEIVVDLAPCCSGLFFDAQSEDPFLRATRVAVQEEADTHAPVPPPLKPGSR